GTYRLESSPRMVSPYDTFISYQVNVDAQGNNIVGDAANEPTISVDPTNGNKIAIGWRQFNTWTSNFRQAGYGYTTDAGTTWHFPGVLQNNVFRSDPVTNSDDLGNFCYLSLLVNTYCGDIWRSTNGGQSWTELSPDGGAHSGDKEWCTIDITPASMGYGFQYQFLTDEFDVCDFGGNGTDVMFARSTNGGASFSAPHRINDDPVIPNKWHWFGSLSVAPNVRIDSVWFDTRNAANNTDSKLFYSYSTDGGVTWAANVEVSAAFNPLEGWPNQSKIGDYITIVSDNTGGDVAYAATFNFNPSRGQHEQAVYYVRVAPTGGATPTPTATASPTATATATSTATATATATA